MAHVIWLGTSGWQYKDWRPGFYPERLPVRLWLEQYAKSFSTVEVNNAFYRLPDRSTFEAWRQRVPDVVFAVKMSRYLTHIKRLRDPGEPVHRFMERAEGLGAQLGPVLLQLPPTLAADPDALDEVLRQFPRRVRVAVEPRHRSWWTDRIRAVLESHNAALCWADRKGRAITPDWRTADWGYLRMHEGAATPRPRYGASALTSWADRIAARFGMADTYVYFNNDPGGAAITDAVAFGAVARKQGIDVSRTPVPGPGAPPYVSRGLRSAAASSGLR
jgi:uncharacterized protein YecE (DUF72 family)